MYDYLKMSKEELITLYKENKGSIEYYQDKINREDKYIIIIIGISFFFTWTVAIIGIYFLQISDILKYILCIIFIFMHIYCYNNVNPHTNYEKIIDNLKNENKIIELVLNIKNT